MSDLLKIYLSYNSRDKVIAKKVYLELKKTGFAPWMNDVDLLPGDIISVESEKAIKNSSIILFFLSSGFDPDYEDYPQITLNSSELNVYRLFKSFQQKRKTSIIPLILEDLYVPAPLRDIQGINFFEGYEQGCTKLVMALQKFRDRINKSYSTITNQNSGTLQNLLISEVELINIRCFEKFSISLEADGKPIQWGMILGDNAAGKTTLLRSIALGLCDQGMQPL